MLRRTLLVAALPVPLSAITVPAPASAANGLTATFSAADNGSWLLDKLIVANPTTAPITGWTLEFDPPTGGVTVGGFHNGTATQNGGHLTVVTGNGGQWWSFDDTWSIQQKTSRLTSKGLLGAMVWEMPGDTASGTPMTAPHNGLSS
jgi:hypothetical protein